MHRVHTDRVVTRVTNDHAFGDRASCNLIRDARSDRLSAHTIFDVADNPVAIRVYGSAPGPTLMRCGGVEAVIELLGKRSDGPSAVTDNQRVAVALPPAEVHLTEASAAKPPCAILDAAY